MSEREEWERLKVVFQAAIDRDPRDRASFLDAACADAPDLRRRIDLMLAAHDDESRFLEEPAYHELSAPGPDSDGASPAANSLQPGDLLDGKYRIECQLGSGGMGIVYRAIHVGLNRRVAVKVVRTTVAQRPASIARFEVEAEALGRLKQPNIVDVTDFGVDRERALPYLVMEHLDGETLAEVLQRDGAVPPVEALKMLAAIAAAVDHAHACGVLHRDLKPANVFLCRGSRQVKLVDFGLASFLDGASANGPAIGTPAYMAPELFRGVLPTRSSDIYSFAVLSHEILHGRLPIDQSEATSDVPPPDRCDFSDALADALSPSQAGRPVLARDVITALERQWSAILLRRWRRHEVPKRVALAFGLALVLGVLALALAQWTPIARLELKAVDLRFLSASLRAPDSRIALVLIDDAALASDPTLLTDRADEFGETLQSVFAAGARGVAIDMLLPEPWSRSKPFSQLVVRHADRLTLAAFSTPTGEVIGPEVMRGWASVALGPERTSALFAFVNSNEDADGITRRVRLIYPDRAGGDRASWAMRAVSTLGDGVVTPERRVGAAVVDQSRYWVDYRVDWRRFERISWKDVRRAVAEAPDRYRGRLILVGGDYAGSGDHARIPGNVTVPGVVLHALIAETILAGSPVRQTSVATAAVWGGVVGGLGILVVLCMDRFSSMALSLGAIAIASLAGSWLLFLWNQTIAPTVTPLVVLGLGSAAALGLRTQLPDFPPEYSLVRLVRGAAPGSIDRPVREGVVMLILVFAQVIGLLTGIQPQPRNDDRPAAIVSALSGAAVVRTGDRATPVAVACFDWIAPGARVEVTSGSRLVVVLLTGKRFELLGGSAASITASGLTNRSGEIRQLTAVPAIPRVDAISSRAQPGANAAGIRVRADIIAGLYPFAGAVSLADATVLSFTPVTGASKYSVTVEDARGAVVIRTQTEKGDLDLPRGLLRAGATYYWRVETLDHVGSTARGESQFTTLPAATERTRRSLSLALESEGDPRSMALVAEIDRTLGLLREALERLRGAAASAPDDPEIRKALDRVLKQLGK